MKRFELRLPATSANLGPGFDAIALALDLFLDVQAELADEFSITASGRNTEICGKLQRNLMLAVYEDIFRTSGMPARPLALNIINDIPIGMGLGSSAAARLTGIALANHFGELGWGSDRIFQKACELEGHPDNAAACWLGGFTVAAGSGERTRALSIDPPEDWAAIVILPDEPLSTNVARAILPEAYSRADAVANIQNVALLVAAFQQRRPDLLALAMEDRLHQSYRRQICPLLPPLLPLAGRDGLLGVALSGAGPSVLALVHAGQNANALEAIRRTLSPQSRFELLQVRLTSRVGASPGALR